jgi:hypothetical protein
VRAQEKMNIPQQLVNADVGNSLWQSPCDLQEASQNPLGELRRLSAGQGDWRLSLVKELQQQREELVGLSGIECKHEQALKCI